MSPSEKDWIEVRTSEKVKNKRKKCGSAGGGSEPGHTERNLTGDTGAVRGGEERGWKPNGDGSGPVSVAAEEGGEKLKNGD